MSWALVAGAAITVVGGAISSRNANKGVDAQTNASLAATEEQRRQYDQTRTDMMPWLDAGTGALTQQQAFLDGDWSGFQNSPDYKWAVDQGFKGLDRGAAAGGNLWGGGADADRIGLGQGLATQYANNYYQKLAGLSGTGQSTAGQLGQFGANTANQIGQNYNNAGQARASGYAAQSNIWNNALQQGYGLWQQNRGANGG